MSGGLSYINLSVADQNQRYNDHRRESRYCFFVFDFNNQEVNETFPALLLCMLATLGAFIPYGADELELIEISQPFKNHAGFFQNFQRYFLDIKDGYHLTNHAVFNFEIIDPKVPMFWFTVKYSSTLLVTELLVTPHRVGIPDFFFSYKTSRDREWILYKENRTRKVGIN